MTLRRLTVPGVALAASLSLVACNLGDPVGVDGSPAVDGDTPEADSDAGVDAVPDADVEGDALPSLGGGSLVFVAEGIDFLTDRLCDLDGDGLGDNALADLGPSFSGLVAAALSASLAGNIADGTRLLLHIPWVDERSLPHAATAQTLLIYGGRDTDIPRDPSDDFAGGEPFYAEQQYLDGCGEPLFASPGTTVDQGHLTLDSAVVPVAFNFAPLTIRGVLIVAQIEPGGRALTGTLCGYSTFADLGSHPGTFEPDMSFLEELTVTGELVGVPALPRLAFDVDVDGDGIERILLDSDNRIASCVDGDDTEIVGRDCWSDPRMADGISFNLRLAAVWARFAGPEPAWEYRVEGECDHGPPETSLFDGGDLFHEGACAPLDERCDPFSLTPCCDAEALCSGASRHDYRCFGPCTPQSCDYGVNIGMCHSGGACVRAGRRVESIPCVDGDEGCTTEYGQNIGTQCFTFNDRTYCYETCEAPPEGSTGCSHGDDYCIPRADDIESGICIVPSA